MRAYRAAEKGFTLIELMMVIVVLALIMSLAIGAAVKSVSAGRELRADAMRDGLKSALVDYYAKEGKWPCALPPDNNTSQFSTFDTVEKNTRVFSRVISKGIYLDNSAFLTVVGGAQGSENARVLKGGHRLSLREAKEKYPGGDFPLGYPNPKDQTEFLVYKVTFNLTTDSVSVER